MNRKVASKIDDASNNLRHQTGTNPILLSVKNQGNKAVQRTFSLPSQPTQYAEAVMNMTLFDPPRWGWTAVGGIADVLSPHEVNCTVEFSGDAHLFF
jgi:hypothetical protein